MAKTHKSSGKTGKYTKKEKREKYTEEQRLKWDREKKLEAATRESRKDKTNQIKLARVQKSGRNIIAKGDTKASRALANNIKSAKDEKKNKKLQSTQKTKK